MSKNDRLKSWEYPLCALWQSRRLMAHAYRVQSGVDDSRHFNGGPLLHQGGHCSNCQKQLSLLWDLDLTDPLIPENVREGFSPATRLPLLICWECLAVSYRIESDQSLKCFPFDSETEFCSEDESPFLDVPQELPRIPLSLTRIPTTIDALLSLYKVIDYEEFDSEAKQLLDTFHGERIRINSDLPVSQLGGQSLPFQSPYGYVCPNPDCPASILRRPYDEPDREYLMKYLAQIHPDDKRALPMLFDEVFQLQYYVCVLCFSIRASYQCT